RVAGVLRQRGGTADHPIEHLHPAKPWRFVVQPDGRRYGGVRRKISNMNTPVIVRAIARGGKFIGDLVGGYRVTVSESGGKTQAVQSGGSSGNTADLMEEARLRTDPLPTNSDTVEMPGHWAASALLSVDVAVPTRATITVVGPGHFQEQQAT